MQTHVDKPDSERAFQCPECSYASDLKASVTRHMKSCGANESYDQKLFKEQVLTGLKRVEETLDPQQIEQQFDDTAREAADVQQSGVPAIDEALRGASSNGAAVVLHYDETGRGHDLSEGGLDFSKDLKPFPAYSGDKANGKHAMTERLEAAKAQSQLLLGRPSSVIIMATGQSQYARNQGAISTSFATL